MLNLPTHLGNEPLLVLSECLYPFSGRKVDFVEVLEQLVVCLVKSPTFSGRF